MLIEFIIYYKWFFDLGYISAVKDAKKIIHSYAAFKVPVMYDGPTLLRKETIRLVCKQLKFPHHLIPPYRPCSNGTVKSLGLEVLRSIRALLSEFKVRILLDELFLGRVEYSTKLSLVPVW